MIYFVTNEQRIFESFKIISVEESLRLLNTLSIVGVDTETKGLDPYTGTLLSLQLGCKEFQVVIDCTTIDIKKYKEFLESDRLFLFWNAKFDLKWLFHYRMVPKRVYDGYLAEKLLWQGYPIKVSPNNFHTINNPRYDYIPETYDKGKKKEAYYMLYMTLKKAGELYLGIELDKTVRGQIIYKGLTDEVIIYAAKDVEYLEDIMNAQIAELKKKGLLTAMEYECKFILPLTYMIYCGVKIDISRWKEKMAKDQAEYEKSIKAMNDWLIANEPNSKYIYINREGNLFAENPYDLTPKVSINWNSAKQVGPIFKKYGVNIETGKNGESKDSIEEKVIAPQADKCSLIPLYIEYKGWAKLVSTYGQNVLDQINKDTGRLYTNYNSIGTDTFRISSGGTDKANNVKYINMLNLPKDAFTRSCFVAEHGNKWISIDYSGQESFIMADISNDKAILKELNYGEKDLHVLTAKIVFNYIPKDMPAEEVKEKFHDERQKSKGYEFAFNYGGTASTIKRNFGLTDEESNRIYNSYMQGFYGLKKYQDFRRKDWWNKGYIDLNPLVGYKWFIPTYEYLKSIQKTLNEPGFWDYYKEMKEIDPSCETVKKVRMFSKDKSDWCRQSINGPIQHTGALCYKVSMVNFFEYLRKENLLFKVLITVTPYDEINCEAPEQIAETIADKLHSIMVKAGSYFVKKCKLEADISRLPDGSLPDHWVH